MDELAMSLIWSRVGFWGCAFWCLFMFAGMFLAKGEGKDTAAGQCLIAFIGMCFFGMHY